MGRIFRLGETPGASGSYEAPVHDSGTASQWGSLSWRADLPAGAQDRVPHSLRQLRQARPHLERMVAIRSPIRNGSRISSPNARYIQWKVEMTGRRRRDARARTA